MNDARTARETDSPRPPRPERRAAAVVAQYIHELSNRHAGARPGSPALAGHPLAGNGAEVEAALGTPTHSR
jgi:hypothetical protein